MRHGGTQAVIDRIMQTYDLLVNCSAAASAEARAKVEVDTPKYGVNQVGYPPYGSAKFGWLKMLKASARN